MFITIDTRETELIQHIQQIIDTPLYNDKHIQVNISMLPLGDVIISDDDNNDLIIIERKSINDLISSIKDGRYEEQSYRLNGSSINNHNIIYLIEGFINTNQNYTNMVYSAIFSLNYIKGFSVIRTFSIEETAFFIVNSVNKLINYSHTHSIENIEKSYSSFIKKVKKDNINADNIGEIMLCQIPGISSTISSIIMTFFDKSFKKLIKQITENPHCLKEITYINSKYQTKHLNKTVIENIIKYII